MKPKEKAQELVDKFKKINEDYIDNYQSIPCALIAVDEIIKALPPFSYGLEFVAKIDFWTKVKTEIEKL
jgi:hypothetical protein